MALFLRQICLVARHGDPVRDALIDLLGEPVCYVDPGVEKFGLQNFLIALGSQFIEVVSPIRDNTAAGRYLDRRGGDGGYMVITQAVTKAEQNTVRANAAQNNVRVAYDSDRGNWHLMQLHPRDMGAAFLEVEWDDVGDVTGHWHPAGGSAWQAHRGAGRVGGIAAVELQSDDPLALARHWALVSGGDLIDGDIPIVQLANADLHFVPDRDGRGAGLSGLILNTESDSFWAAAQASGLTICEGAVEICGTRFKPNSTPKGV